MPAQSEKNKKIKKLAELFEIERSKIIKILASTNVTLDDDGTIWRAAITELDSEERSRKQKHNAGFVYVMGCEKIFAPDIYKIGFTHAVEARVETLNKNLGFKRRLRLGDVRHKNTVSAGYFPIFSWEVPDKATWEKYLHQLFIKYWIIGEFFKITINQLLLSTLDFFPESFKDYRSQEEIERFRKSLESLERPDMTIDQLIELGKTLKS